MIKSSWAVLLCKFNDDSTEPFTRDYYENLFTASGVGSQNMVDFFRDVSHGNLDLSDSRVFGWYTLDKQASEYGLTGAEKLKNRGNLINWARQAAAAKGDDVSQSPVVVCMNVPTDLFGGGAGVVCDNLSMEPRFLGQEMGHFYGLDPWPCIRYPVSLLLQQFMQSGLATNVCQRILTGEFLTNG